MDSAINRKWSLLCLPKSRHRPVTITEEQASLLELVGRSFNLVMARDEKLRKVYLGHGHAVEAEATLGLRFPSGWTADIIHDEDAGAKYRSYDSVVAAPLISAFPDAQVSKFFRLSEFRPGRRVYDYIRLSPELLEALDEIRERAGRPVTVISGYRPPDYNRQAGKPSTSTHVDGLAADIYSDGLTTYQLRGICEKVIGRRGGVGYNPKSGYIHVDLRGYQARWSGS
jgi:hypothetical protein